MVAGRPPEAAGPGPGVPWGGWSKPNPALHLTPPSDLGRTAHRVMAVQVSLMFGGGEPMVVDGLLIPDLLQAMLAEGRWPCTTDEASKQYLHSRVPKDRNRRLRSIYLYAPPFHTLARTTTGGGRDFDSAFALHELVPEASVGIADFGLGADAPILLDYRAGPTDPRVIHLEWADRGDANYWVVMAENFAEFVDLLGL